MKLFAATIGLLVGALALGEQDAQEPADPQGPAAPGPEALAKAGKTFAHSCAKCHLPPDPSFATDRAWLSQVHDTA